MELDVKKSKILKISLRILVAVILLSVGVVIGSHARNERGYREDGNGCGNFGRFEHGRRQNMMQGGRRGEAQGGFRMMVPQAINATIQSQPATSANTSTPSVAPITK